MKTKLPKPEILKSDSLGGRHIGIYLLVITIHRLNGCPICANYCMKTKNSTTQNDDRTSNISNSKIQYGGRICSETLLEPRRYGLLLRGVGLQGIAVSIIGPIHLIRVRCVAETIRKPKSDRMFLSVIVYAYRTTGASIPRTLEAWSKIPLPLAPPLLFHSNSSRPSLFFPSALPLEVQTL